MSESSMQSPSTSLRTALSKDMASFDKLKAKVNQDFTGPNQSSDVAPQNPTRTMFVSIIIPTLNEEGNITQSLQALSPFRAVCEVIVVDGGSADATFRLAAELADTVVISKPGRAVQMNQGARAAKGDVLLFLHADTLLPPNALELLARQLGNRQGWGRFDILLEGKPVMLRVVAGCMNLRSRWTGIATGDQVIFVEKSLFDQVGGYPELALMEDIALSAKLKRLTPPLCLPEKVISSGRRWEKFGVFKTIGLMWSLRLSYFLGANPVDLANRYREGRLWKR